MDKYYDSLLCLNLPNSIKAKDAGRGYEQIKREAKGLITTSKNLTNQLNKFNAALEDLNKSIKSDPSLENKQIKELTELLNQARNYIHNHLELEY